MPTNQESNWTAPPIVEKGSFSTEGQRGAGERFFMPTHDPLRFVNALSSKLASRSRHICVFIGAGSSRACGLPDVTQLQQIVLDRLEAVEREQLTRQLQGRNLEQALSRVRRLAALLEDESELEGLNRETALNLDRKVCEAIIDELSVDRANLGPMHKFAAWAGRADYHWPLEIFSVNYDLLVETAFEQNRLPYFDGFVGNIQARFHTDLVEGTPEEPERWILPSFVRLWKLHGSVNWAWDTSAGAEIVRMGSPVSSAAAAIYPSDTKYDESRRMPFLVLQDRFRRALAQPETLTLVSGYAFGDEHLNEMFFDAAARRPRSETIVFCHSDIPTVVLERAQRTPNLQAVTTDKGILGGRLAEWEPPKEDLLAAGFWDDGKFTLGDFSSLAAHLALCSPSSQSESSVLAGESPHG